MKDATLTAERHNQKERTRQKLLKAARAIIKTGDRLTIAVCAQRAGIAEATAYRYYRNPRSLLRDAMMIDWSGLETVIADLEEMDELADRAQRGAEELARFVLQHEINIRQLFASTEQEPRDRTSSNGLPRTSFRRRLIDAILQGTEAQLGEMRRSVELALTVIISPHAVLILHDAMPADHESVVTEAGSMARRLCTRIE